MSSLPILAPRLPGSSHLAGPRPCPKEHSEQEWQDKKNLIRELYISDNRKLHEIMAIMEAKHSFAATYVLLNSRV